MTKPQNHILAAALMLLGGRAFAQTNALTDKEIIDMYCDGEAPEKGRYVNVNGKTNLECDEGSARYLFEKTNAKLGLANKKALKRRAYEVHPSKWKELTVDYLFEQANQKQKDKCSKVEFINDLPVFHCTPKNIAFTKNMFESYQAAFRAYYNKGAENFSKDPNQTELATFLMAKDTRPDQAQNTKPTLSIKDYFTLPDLESKFPGFDQLTKTDFSKDFNADKITPRFWITQPSIALDVKPMTFKEYSARAHTSQFLLRENTHIFPKNGNASIAAYQAGRMAQLAARAEAAEIVDEPKAAETNPVETTAVETTTIQPAVVETTPEVVVTPKSESSCQDQLTMALAKLLEDDKQNIIGHQYELTVLKLASLAMNENKTSLEDLIRKQSAKIAKMDKGIIEQMNQVYKEHGLKVDAQKITDHLKQKAVNASYYPRDKRFFNQDSSAFVLAYQKMNPAYGIKDTDISVLWFMDKVSKKARKSHGKFSATANRTNLSTRIAQYTGLTGAKKAYSKDELTAMAANQKIELDAELNGFIENFKQENAECYKELFTEGKADCDLSVVEGSLSQLLAVQSQIPSTDLINLDEQLNGSLDKSRFQILKFANEN